MLLGRRSVTDNDMSMETGNGQSCTRLPPTTEQVRPNDACRVCGRIYDEHPVIYDQAPMIRRACDGVFVWMRCGDGDVTRALDGTGYVVWKVSRIADGWQARARPVLYPTRARAEAA